MTLYPLERRSKAKAIRLAESSSTNKMVFTQPSPSAPAPTTTKPVLNSGKNGTQQIVNLLRQFVARERLLQVVQYGEAGGGSRIAQPLQSDAKSRLQYHYFAFFHERLGKTLVLAQKGIQ
jgi:hypothetical protein